MNAQHSQIQEFILYEFKVGHSAMEVTKNIFCPKGKGTVDNVQSPDSSRNFSLIARTSMIW